MVHNRLYFAGYVGKDAELFTTTSGVKIVSFSLCATKKGKDGKPDINTWVRVKVFGNWCDLASSFKKGDNVMVEGELQVTTYKDKLGTDKMNVDVLANSLAPIKKPERQTPDTPVMDPFDNIPF